MAKICTFKPDWANYTSLKVLHTNRLHSRIMYCNMDMRYVDANETNNIKLKNGDKYVHMITYMLVKYIQYMHIRLTRTIMRYLFGNRVGRHNATQIRESSL